MKFGFIAKHRGIWPLRWICEALGVSRAGFYAWLTRVPSEHARSDDEELSAKVRASFLASDRTYGARRVWRDVLAEGMVCGLHLLAHRIFTFDVVDGAHSAASKCHRVVASKRKPH